MMYQNPAARTNFVPQLILASILATTILLGWTFVARADPKELAPAMSPEAEILQRVASGVELWERGGGSRAQALGELGRAIERADSGRRPGEDLAACYARYRTMIGGDGPARLRELVSAIARARFYLAEDAFERCQSITMPPFRPSAQLSPSVRRWWSGKQGTERAREWEQMLRFLPPDERRTTLGSVQFQHWVEKSFASWREQRDEARAAAEKLYLAAVEEDVPEWEVASAARIGELYQTLAEAFESAPIDPSIQADQDLADIYRDALDQAARPYRESAIKAYEHGSAVAKQYKISSRWSRDCEAALGRLAP